MKYHIVRQGDCLASISEEYGFLLSTIWNHPENAKLRSCRKDPNVLFPGDKVFIPDADVRVEESTTDERHTFQLLNEATVLHTRFIRNNRPSAGERFLLVVDSCEVRAGVLDDDGALMVPILGGSCPLERSASLEGEGIGSRAGFAQSVSSDSFGGHFRKIAFFLLFATPSQQGIVDQRVLHIDDDAGGGVHTGQFLDSQNCLEELGSASTVLLGDFDAHQSELEEIVDQVFVEDTFLVHILDQRADFLVGKLANVVAEENLVFGKRRQGRGSGGLQRLGHGAPSRVRWADCFMVALR